MEDSHVHSRLRRREVVRVMLIGFLWFVSGTEMMASGLRIDNVELNPAAPSSHPVVRFTLSWENSWRNAKNHDAAWVFVDLRGEEDWNRTRMPVLYAEGVRLTADSPEPAFEISDDRLGVFVHAAANHRGPARLRVDLTLDRGAIRNRNPAEMTPAVFGIEMVEIPEGAFTLGDPDPAALEFGAFFAANAAGEPAGLVRIEAERQSVPVGPREGHLDYKVERDIYQGDREGPIPETFPKGFDRFYIMKYEMTQGQYAAFLNNLSRNATYFRANFGGRDYYEFRGSIRLTGDRYVATSPERPANFIS